MNRTQKIALVALALLALLVGWLASRNRRPPFIPPDADHAGVAIADCVACHGPDGGAFRGKNHPVGLDCDRCHAFE